MICFGPLKKAWFPDSAEHSHFIVSFFWCINYHLKGKKAQNLVLLGNVSSPKPAARQAALQQLLLHCSLELPVRSDKVFH